ncbi:MAG: hydrolase [Methylobacter sp.]
MQSYIFLDLDDTLFQSIKKCVINGNDPDLKALAYLKDGSPISYATPKQQWLWQWLSQGFRVVPATARNYNAFNRVDLPFREEVILDHGAIILDKNRNLDKVWMNTMLESLPAYQEKLLDIWNDVEAHTKKHAGLNPRLISDFDSLWYGVIKHTDGNEVLLKTLLNTVIKPHPSIEDGSLYWHFNGNNLAILPKTVNKESAVSYLIKSYRQRYGELLTFGAGDSRTDAPFMSLCDYALIPKNTQLSRLMATA